MATDLHILSQLSPNSRRLVSAIELSYADILQSWRVAAANKPIRTVNLTACVKSQFPSLTTQTARNYAAAILSYALLSGEVVKQSHGVYTIN